MAQQHAAGDGEVAVEPGVPQAAAVCLHGQHLEARLVALGHRLQLQARAAPRAARLACWLPGDVVLAWLLGCLVR